MDRDKDKVVDCDILNPVAQSSTLTGSVDDCGQLGGNSVRFANALTGLTQINPDILGGWGTRPSNWQFGLALQQELLPRVSMEVAYNRRTFSNFFVTDNQALGPDDYETGWQPRRRLASARRRRINITRYLVNRLERPHGQNYGRREERTRPARTTMGTGSR